MNYISVAVAFGSYVAFIHTWHGSNYPVLLMFPVRQLTWRGPMCHKYCTDKKHKLLINLTIKNQYRKDDAKVPEGELKPEHKD